MQHIAVFLDLSNNLQRAVLRGIQRYVVGKPWIYHMAPPQKEFAPTLAEWKPNGVIGRLVAKELRDVIEPLNIPAVHTAWKGPTPSPRTAMVLPDDDAIGRLAAEHFIELGFDHFAFFGPVTTESRCRRDAGFSKMLAEAGKADSHSFMLPSDIPPWHSWADFDHIVGQWLLSLPKPTAILAGHDGGGQELAPGMPQDGNPDARGRRDSGAGK